MAELTPILFDHAARRKHLARHAASAGAHDFLWQETAQHMMESLSFLTPRFARVLELGPRSPHLSDALRHRPGTQEVLTDSEALLCEELPYAPQSFDGVISNLSLHAVNDLPGLLVQIRRLLKPDGLFMATMPGAQSLYELRQVLAEAESQLRGGISPRIAPFLEVRDAGNLLQRAGFALPVVDSATLKLSYSNLFTLCQELRGAGEANMLAARARHFTPRRVFVQAAERYAAHHSEENGRVSATMEIITLTGWAPAASQQQPAKRGSGNVSFTEIF